MHQVRVNFFSIYLGGSADHFSFLQNNCAYSLCVNLTPLICATYLTICVFPIYLCVPLSHISFGFNQPIFFHILVSLKTAVFIISQIRRQKSKKVNVNPRQIKDSFNHSYGANRLGAQVILSMCILPCSDHFVFNS